MIVNLLWTVDGLPLWNSWIRFGYGHAWALLWALYGPNGPTASAKWTPRGLRNRKSRLEGCVGVGIPLHPLGVLRTLYGLPQPFRTCPSKPRWTPASMPLQPLKPVSCGVRPSPEALAGRVHVGVNNPLEAPRPQLARRGACAYSCCRTP